MFDMNMFSAFQINLDTLNKAKALDTNIVI